MTVELKGGLLVGCEVLSYLVGMEFRGFTFTASDGRIYVEPRAAVTERDAAFITEHRSQVLGLVGYVAPEARTKGMG